MKCAGILPLAIVLATTCAVSQDIVLHRSPNSFTPSYPIPRAGCPVGLQVNHGTFFLERKVDKEFGPGPYAAVPPAVAGQKVHIIVTNLLLRDIVSAQLTVRGFSDKRREIPLANLSQAPDLTKEVNLVLGVKANGQASSDLSLSRFTSIAAVDVDSLTYADGSSWHSSSPGVCSVRPSLLMLLGSTQ